jgi:hypothetical protein
MLLHSLQGDFHLPADLAEVSLFCFVLLVKETLAVKKRLIVLDLNFELFGPFYFLVAGL